MRSKAAAIALALAFSTTLVSASFVVPQEAQAQSRRGYDMFYDDLAQDGRWIDHPRYGWVWYPTRVRADWRPYSDGRWVWTDRYGWYWESNERFGWATYHYGRWGYDDRYGHIWVPGDEWAPAWVSFRDSDEAIGWAPLPPETLGMTLLALLAGGSSSSHYRYVDLSDSYYQPRWVFVPTRYFTQPRVYSHAYSWRDNDRYFRGSRNVTNYVTVNNYYVNRSIDRHRWESRTGRKIDQVHVRDANSRDQWRQMRERRDERNVAVFKPRIERDERGERSAPREAVRAKADDKPAVQVRPELAAPDERRANIRARNDRDGNDRDRTDRDGSDRDGNDRDNRPGVTTPTDRAAQPDRDRNDGDRNRVQQQRAEQERTQQQKAQQERAEQQRAQQQKVQQERAQQQKVEQERAQQQRVQQQKAQQEKAQQQRVQQQKVQQERAQQQRAQQEKAQQQRVQQQKVQQQRAQQQKIQQERAKQQRAAPARAQPAERATAPQRARPPQQAERPEPRRQEQKQPQRQQRGGNECGPGQSNCR